MRNLPLYFPKIRVMKLHKNASLTLKQRGRIQALYQTGQYSQQPLAARFGTSRTTIAKWVSRSTITDPTSRPHRTRCRITAGFEQAVIVYRANPVTAHHGKVRIACELKNEHTCSHPSNVDLVGRRAGLNAPKKAKPTEKHSIQVGKHRTQMAIQQLAAVEGNQGFEYKISIIHLSTRIKYSSH
jgi:hypothetical protein